MGTKWKEAASLACAQTLDLAAQNRNTRRDELDDHFFKAYHGVNQVEAAPDTHTVLTDTTDSHDSNEDKMLMAEERGLRGEYQTEDLYLSVIQSLKKHPQQDELASAARSIFNPTEEQARYFKAADTCVQLEDLTHQVSIETIALHMFPEEWRTLPGKIYYTLEVVAPHKTGRHKYNTRRRVRGDFLSHSSKVDPAESMLWEDDVTMAVAAPSKCAIQIELWYECTDDSYQARAEGKDIADAGTFSTLDPGYKQPPTQTKWFRFRRQKSISSRAALEEQQQQQQLQEQQQQQGGVSSFSPPSSLSGSSLSLSTTVLAPNTEMEPRFAGSGLILLGRAFLDLKALSPNESIHTIKLHSVNKKHPLSLHVSAAISHAEPSLVVEEARRKHRSIVQRILLTAALAHLQDERCMTSARHLQSAAQRGAGPTQELLERRGQLPAWDGTMPQSYSEIMMRHATCNSIDSRLRNLDFFCILMELHAYCTIKVTCIAKHITSLFNSLGDTSTLSENDQARLVAVMQATYSFVFPNVTQPILSSDTRDDIISERRAQLRCLYCIFGVDLWQQSIAHNTTTEPGTPVTGLADISLSGTEAAEMLQWVESYLRLHENVTYVALKTKVVQKFGAELFEAHKKRISDMTLEAALTSESTGATAAQRDFFQRLKEMLKEGDIQHMTFARVREQLLQEFTRAIVDKHSRVIAIALNQEMQRRREQHTGDCILMDALDIKVELRKALEDKYAHRFTMLEKRTAREEDSHEEQLDHAVTLVDAVLTDLDACAAVSRDLETEIRGFSFLHAALKGYDAATATFVQNTIAKCRPRNEEPVPRQFFTLYFLLNKKLPPLLHVDDEPLWDIQQYPKWFEPLVLQWLRLSYTNSKQWILNSLALEKWTAYDSRHWYSTSALDVFRALFEILEFYEQLNWPVYIDREAAEEFLFADLSRAVANCVKFYAEQTVVVVSTDEKDAFIASKKPYFYTIKFCTAINNLEQARLALQEVRSYIRVDEIAQSHRIRAEKANEGHSGHVRPHKALKYFEEAFDAIEAAAGKLSIAASSLIVPLIEKDINEMVRDLVHIPLEGIHDHVEAKLGFLLDPTEDHSSSQEEPADGFSRGRRMTTTMKKRKKCKGTAIEKLQCALSPILNLDSDCHEIRATQGYLYQNMEDLVSGLAKDSVYLDAVLTPLFASIVEVARDAVLLASQHLKADVAPVQRFAMALRIILKDFFFADGNGLEAAVLDEKLQEQFNPILRYLSTDLGQLIADFFDQASEYQADPINDAILKELGDLHAMKNSNRVANTRGVLNIEVLYQASQQLLRVFVLKSRGIKVKQSYLNTRLQPTRGDADNFKDRSKTFKGPDSPAYNACFDIPRPQHAKAVQIRVQCKSLLFQDKVVLGEVLIPIKPFLKLNGRTLAFSMPLVPLEYPGQSGWLQNIIQIKYERDQSDLEAHQFVTKYQLRSELKAESDFESGFSVA